VSAVDSEIVLLGIVHDAAGKIDHSRREFPLESFWQLIVSTLATRGNIDVAINLV
jgi:hypothetical protein